MPRAAAAQTRNESNSRPHHPARLVVIRLRRAYAEALYADDASPVRDVREAVTMLEDVDKVARRILGEGNPVRLNMHHSLVKARKKLISVDDDAAVEAAAEQWC